MAGAGSQLQFAQNGGGEFANAIMGAGELHLIGGTLQLTEAAGANTYSGGTVVETGSTLDLTTNQVSTGNANITDAGGLIVFDQDFSGTYTGVISDGLEMGTGPMLSGSLDIDDSAADNASSANVTLTAQQTYTGDTYVEAGTLTLDTVNAIADSSGVILGRVGGAVDAQTANLVLDANNQLTSLSSEAGNTTSVVLNGNVLTLAPTPTSTSSYGGSIVDGSAAGSLVIAGTGTVSLSGSDSFSGGVTLDSGTLVLDNSSAAGTGAITFDTGATLSIGFGDTPTNLIKDIAIGDTIDLQGVGTETTFTYVAGVLTVSGGSQSVALDIAQPPTHEGFDLTPDGNGGTILTVAPDAGPTITPVAPSIIGPGQTIEIGTVAPGLSGDTLTLQQTGGDGTVSLELVKGVEEVIYTAPSDIGRGILDSVSYTVTDEYNDAATGSSMVPVAPSTDTDYVGTADRILLVGNGNSAINALAGHVTILGGNGSDIVFAGTMDGMALGNGNDTVLGGSGDTILMGNGTDTISTGADSLVLVGNGSDTIAVGASSSVFAGNGADTVIAGPNDYITVGNGADIIYGAAGDTISVGKGHDTFAFGISPGETTAGLIGPVTINDFNPNTDVIEIASTLASWDSSYAALTSPPSHITTDARGDAVIHLDSNASDIITLVGVHVSSLHASDFNFV